MCGINGKISTKRELVTRELIHKMNESIKYRGPDAEGIELIDNQADFVGLGHRRLKIIDLSDAANQPFISDDKSIQLVFNGEIYNFQELKKEYLSEEKFRTSSDTEVILKLYQKEGMDFVKKLRGMFAIAIYDQRSATLYLIRDNLGKKPLFYYQDQDSLIFSSQLQPILLNKEVKKEIDLSVIDDYLSFNYVPGNNSIYKNIKKLPPASILEFKMGRIKISKYWSIDFSRKEQMGEEELLNNCERLLEEAVSLRMISDVPLGAFLSGGVDSSLIVALMSRLTDKVKTFSIGFEQEDFSELKFARKIANDYKTEHTEFVVTPKAVEIIDDLVNAFDEPYADPSQIPMYYLAKMTREHVTVALNGDGGDEGFAGYERYLGMLYQNKYRVVPKFLRKAFYALIKNIPENSAHRSLLRRLKWLNKISLGDQASAYLNVYRSFDENIKEGLYTPQMKEVLGKGSGDREFLEFFDSKKAGSLIDKMLYTDINTYLPQDLLVKADRSTMFHSLESRSPFLDYKLLEFTAAIPGNIKMKNNKLKYLLKKIAAKHLPKEILDRPKQGFGIPLGSWFKKDLKDYSLEIFAESKLVKEGLFNKEYLDSFIEEHMSGKVNHGRRLFSLLMLERWFAICGRK